MKIERHLSVEAVLKELGERLTQRRLDLKLTQADLAEQAGVSKRTVERIEAGETAQMSTMVRILQVLELTEGLNQLIAEAGPRPMDFIKNKGTARKRASSKPGKSRTKQWKWGDET